MRKAVRPHKALVTGPAGGIGREIVALLRETGATVTAADCSLEGLEADHILPGDLGDSSYCDQLPGRAAEAMGGLSLLINNAGVARRGTACETTDTDYAPTLAINLEAPFRLCRAAIPLLAECDGSAIVNTSSCWSLYPGPAHLVYCVSKGALAMMTKCLARDHAHQGIRVNAVCPNEVDTPMLRSGFEQRGLDPHSAIATLNSSVPLGRIAEPGEIAQVMLWLASPAASYVTGACVEVNGAKPVI